MLSGPGKGYVVSSLDSEVLALVPVLDEVQIKFLENSVDGDLGFLRDLLETFARESEFRLESLAANLYAEDRKTALQDVHFIAGSAASIGLKRFSLFCRTLEMRLRAGEVLLPGLPDRTSAYHREGLNILRERWG